VRRLREALDAQGTRRKSTSPCIKSTLPTVYLAYLPS
jgi:hypothetical protein